MRPRRLFEIAAVALATAVLVFAAWRTIPEGNVCPDFIQFWTAATALEEGENPYDVTLQARVQGELGWKKEEAGLGVYDFLPYYYPPWLGMAFVPLLPLGYALAKMSWLVALFEMMVASGLLLTKLVRGLSPIAIFSVLLGFGFSIRAVAMGQVAPLVLLLVCSAWYFLEQRRDVAAGVLLALLSIKPQLTVLLIGVLLVVAFRQKRWSVIGAFGATLLALCLVSTMVFPGWLPAMIAATTETPMPTHYYPGLGTTWLVALGALGVSGGLLQLLWIGLSLLLLFALARLALTGERPLAELIGAALILPFFVAPYARPYDFPVLMIPALLVMQSLVGLGRMLFGAVLVLATGLHILELTANHVPPVVGVTRPEYTYFWIPLFIAAAWLRTQGVRGQAPKS